MARREGEPSGDLPRGRRDRTAPTRLAIEVRGRAELHETGGESINPRFPNFAPEFIRIRPRRIVSWGLEVDATPGAATGEGIRHHARDVAPQESG